MRLGCQTVCKLLLGILSTQSYDRPQHPSLKRLISLPVITAESTGIIQVPEPQKRWPAWRSFQNCVFPFDLIIFFFNWIVVERRFYGTA